MSLFRTILSQVQARLDLQSRSMEAIAAIVTQVTGVTVHAAHITLRRGTLRIAVAPTVKMAIVIKKEAILASLKEKGISVCAIA